jgi:hypothetical protein
MSRLSESSIVPPSLPSISSITKSHGPNLRVSRLGARAHAPGRSTLSRSPLTDMKAIRVTSACPSPTRRRELPGRRPGMVFDLDPAPPGPAQTRGDGSEPPGSEDPGPGAERDREALRGVPETRRMHRVQVLAGRVMPPRSRSARPGTGCRPCAEFPSGSRPGLCAQSCRVAARRGPAASDSSHGGGGREPAAARSSVQQAHPARGRLLLVGRVVWACAQPPPTPSAPHATPPWRGPGPSRGAERACQRRCGCSSLRAELRLAGRACAV